MTRRENPNVRMIPIHQALTEAEEKIRFLSDEVIFRRTQVKQLQEERDAAIRQVKALIHVINSHSA